jgi:translation initiation factor IF-1
MIINKKVKVKWVSRNKKHYESLGYTYTKIGDEFEVNTLDLSKGSNVIVECICDFCDNSFNKIYQKILSTRIYGKDACRNCILKIQGDEKRNNASLKENLLQSYPDIAKEWSPNNKLGSDKYSPNSGQYVLWTCENGHEWEARITNRVYRNNKCDKCNSLAFKNPILAKEWSPKNEKTPWDYDYSSNQKVYWLCKNKHEWVTSINNRSRTNCPFCNESNGEKEIFKFLTQKNFEFKQQFEFKNLLSENNYPLRFDFAVLKSGDLQCLIEYDGEQHFHNIYGEDTLSITKYRDNLKDDYCLKANIKLIRIPYWELNKIQEILEVSL